MLPRFRLPSPAMAVALAALFVALSGTAMAAGIVPLAKRALTADKAVTAADASRLEGKTAVQVAEIPGPATSLGGLTAPDIAAMPGPASTAAGLVTMRTTGWSMGRGSVDFWADCQPGERATGGGFDVHMGPALATMSRPGWDGKSWRVRIVSTTDAEGSIFVECIK